MDQQLSSVSIIICFYNAQERIEKTLEHIKKLKQENLEVELILSVSGAGIKTNEFPISYSPRSKEQGKKMSMLDGLSCILYLLSFRYKK